MTAGSMNTYLIDPELIAASDEYASDIAFWDRLAIVSEFEGHAMIGGETSLLFDSFCVYCFTNTEALSSVYREYAGFDITNVLSRLSFVSSFNRQDVLSPSNTLYDIPEEEYRPVYGCEGCADALSIDLGEMADPRIIVDRDSWPSLTSGTGHPLESLFAVDVNYGPKGCVRAWLAENMSFDNIQSYAAEAFPDLRFCDETWKQIDLLRQREHELSRILCDSLAAINDHALKIWENTTLKEERERQMNALGIDCGPENPRDTRGRYGEMRTFHYQEDAFTMSWHVKLTKTFGRMYFDVNPLGGNVTIGLITGHLSVSNGNLKK